MKLYNTKYKVLLLWWCSSLHLQVLQLPPIVSRQVKLHCKYKCEPE